MVPMAGLEPAQLSPLPPQDSVSTNSTTSAKVNKTLVILRSGLLRGDVIIRRLWQIIDGQRFGCA